MNRQGENKIQWCHYSWNPISGCLHKCPYCYVPRVLGRFDKECMKPRFHEKRLHEKMPSKSSRIFVGSTGDMWGEWVPNKWINRVLDIVNENPQHRFIFLTKNPSRYQDYKIPENAWCGTSIEGSDQNGRVDELNISAPLIGSLYPSSLS